MAMVQLLPCTASGCHPQSQGTVKNKEEVENEMCISHMSVFAGLQRVLVLLFLLSAGFPQAYFTPCEVSQSHRGQGIDGSLCQAENLLSVGFAWAMPRGLLYSSAKAVYAGTYFLSMGQCWALTPW